MISSACLKFCANDHVKRSRVDRCAHRLERCVLCHSVNRTTLQLETDQLCLAFALSAQVTQFYNEVLTEEERARLTENIAGHLKDASAFIQERAVANFTKVDADYGSRIATLLKQYSN